MTEGAQPLSTPPGVPEEGLARLLAAGKDRGHLTDDDLIGILETVEEGETHDKIQSAARTAGFRIKDLSHHHVRAYSPTKYQTAFDVTVARG